MTAPRSRAERRRDAFARLEGDVDLWVASADAAGNASRPAHSRAGS